MNTTHAIKIRKFLGIFLSISLLIGLVIFLLIKSEKERIVGENEPHLTLPNLANQLAYVDDMTGGLSVLKLNERKPLILHQSESVHSPRWSPDGSHIAYSISKKNGSSFIMTMNLRTRTEKLLYRSNKYCVVLAWPNMNELNIVDFDPECCRTKVVYMDSGKVRDMTQNFDFESIKTLIDGKKFEGESNALSFNDDELRSVVVIPSMNKKQEIHYFYERGYYPFLIFDPETRLYKAVPIIGNSNDPPTWSPDDRKIAFASEKDYAIYLYDVDSASVSQVSWHKYLRFMNPSWSSDGQYLVFASASREADMPREKGIFLFELASKKLFRVTERGREPALF